MIRPLTSLRFVFAFMVFCCHCPFYNTPGSISFWVQNHVLNEGFIGVSFFFILSGFILSLNYADKISSGTIGPKHFWILRFTRIYPLYLLTLLAEIPFALQEFRGHVWEGLAKLFACVFMIQSWVPDMSWTAAFNTPSWSISAEAFFYAAFPLLVVWVVKPRRGLWLICGLMIALALGMSFTAPAWEKIIFYNNPLGASANSSWASYSIGFLRRGPSA